MIHLFLFLPLRLPFPNFSLLLPASEPKTTSQIVAKYRTGIDTTEPPTIEEQNE